MLKSKLTTIGLWILFVASAGALVLQAVIGPNFKKRLDLTNQLNYSSTKTVEVAEVAENIIKSEEDIRRNLIAEVNNYIKQAAPKSKVSAAVIVDLCIKHDFDISLLLAQGHIESHFATAGRAKRTNSVFGVGAFDNGKNLYTYKDPNESIEPYIRLVKDKYLRYNSFDDEITVRERNINELLNRNYRSKGGALYAQSPNYGSKVKGVRNKINRQYDIIENQAALREMHSTKQLVASIPSKVEKTSKIE